MDVHHIYCPECRSMSYEHLEFPTNPRARIFDLPNLKTKDGDC